jgi:hypothetical protein
MAIFMVHEVNGSLSGPYFDRGTDPKGQENTDMCAWNFGATKTIKKKAGARMCNLTSGDSSYLLQRNWQANNFVKEVVNDVDNDYSNIR